MLACAREFPGEDIPTDIPGVGIEIRKVTTEIGSPLYERIGEAYRENLPDYLFWSWDIRRRYGKRELERAEVFVMRPDRQWQISGDDCGTCYDATSVCPDCGGGLRREGSLMIDVRKLPKKSDFVGSYSCEWTVSGRFVELATRHGLSGCRFAPVIHVPYIETDHFDLELVPSGSEIERLVREAGLAGDRVRRAVFVGRPKIMVLHDRAEQEYVTLYGESPRVKAARTRAMRATPPAPRFELVVTSNPVEISSETYINHGPFDLEDESRCALHGGEFGHSIGRTLISELYIKRATWDGSDIAATGQLFGKWHGSYKPGPVFVVTPRFRQWVLDNKIRGCSFERAHLV